MTTPRLLIPEVPQGTLDPAAGINIALRVLDALVQARVVSMSLTAPPGSPVDGALYVVAAFGGTATGVWAGQETNLARYVEEGDFWQFYAAGTQVTYAFNIADGGFYVFDSGWAQIQGGGGGDSNTVGGGAWTTTSVVLRPATLTGNVNDWAPSGITPGALIYISCGASSRNITGIDSTGFSDGDVVHLFNRDSTSASQPFVLMEGNGSSAAGNQFLFRSASAANISIPRRCGITLVYDGTDSGWRYIGTIT